MALIALVVVGGATRVMEAGLACPDWPLCYGVWFPGRQMDLKVFLEWFHRLDAFVIGVAILVQMALALRWRFFLPIWHVWVSLSLVILVVLQGALGASTVQNLLSSKVVTSHLILALILVAITSGMSQALRAPSGVDAPAWWSWMARTALIAVIFQCLLGGRMASTWAAQRCLELGQGCEMVSLHQNSATPVGLLVLIFVFSSFAVRGWTRSQWPFLLAVLVLVLGQMTLGMITLNLGLENPLLTVFHQLAATLLVALLAALSFRSPHALAEKLPEMGMESPVKTCHG